MEKEDKSLQSTIMVSLITAICLLGDSMLYVVLPLYWQDFGLDTLWQVGILLSVNRLVRLPFNAMAVWFYDRFGQRNCMVLAVILAIVTTAMYSFLMNFWLLVVVRSVWGIAWTFLRLGAYFSILHYAPLSQLGYHMGIYNGVFRLGSLFGMLLGALIAEFIAPTMTGYVFAVCSIFALPLVFIYIPKELPSHREEKAKEDKVSSYDRTAKGVLLNSFSTAFVYQGIFISMLSYLAGYNNIRLDFLAVYGFGAASIVGILQAMRWAWEPWLAPKIGRMSDGKWGRASLLRAFCACAAALFLVVSFAMPVWLWLIIIILLQFAGTGITTLSDAVASDVALGQKNKVKFMGAHSFAIDFGSAIGPIVGYTLNSYLGIHAVFIVASMVLLAMTFVWYRLKLRVID